MKSLLRVSLFAVFAAAGMGLATWLALRTEQNDLASGLSLWLPAPSDFAQSLPSPRSSDSPVIPRAPDKAPRSQPDEMVDAHAETLTPAEPSSPTRPSPPNLAPAPPDATYHLTIGQQMGRIEEKLRRAEEHAERQQRSLETVLTAFQHQKTRPTQNVSLRQPASFAVDVAPADSAAEDVTPALPPIEPLPAPASRGDIRILPEEGDGLLTLNLRNSDLRQVLDLLSEQHGLNIVASPTVQGAVTARLSNVSADAALDAVLKATGFVARREGNVIYVATPDEFLVIDHAHDRLNTRVYRPNYITAAEMQQLLTPLMTPDVGVVSVSTPAQVGIPSDNIQAGGDSFSGTDVVLVQDYESNLLRIDQLLLELDARPLQVAIETMIVTVNLNDSNEFGVNFRVFQGNPRLISGTPLDDLTSAPLDGGLKFGYLDGSISAFIRALESVGDTNVVAAPRVMVLNKQRAGIHIGAKLGYVSTTTATETASTQAVEFLEVGTQLRIRPFISNDGMIRLEVHPELSTGSVELKGERTLPNKNVTEVTTNIMCRDGATVVLGGLIREDLSSSSTQIPVLGTLPVVGAAFRQKRETLLRTETLVLLTPRVINPLAAAVEGEQGKIEYLRRQDVRYDKMNPLAQRYYGKQYLRKARAAWNAGDATVALRYANLAIHFDPENLEAINLRSEIVETTGVGDRTIESHLREGLAPWGHPRREYSRQGAPWKKSPDQPILNLEPPHPGEPGKIGKLDPPYLPHGPLSPVPREPQPLAGEEIPEVVIPAPLPSAR